MSPRLPTPSTAAAIIRVARLPVNPTRSEGMSRSRVIAGRFNDRSVGSTDSATNGIEVARTTMKIENVHRGCVSDTVVIAPPYSFPLTRGGIFCQFSRKESVGSPFSDRECFSGNPPGKYHAQYPADFP